MKLLRNLATMSILLLQAACSVFGIRSEETPKYEVVLSDNNKEIRKYSQYIVAKTKVTGEYRQAQTEAFRILAGYIFGGNVKKKSISMTAPVVQRQSDNQVIAMTAPVVQSQDAQGWVMTFMMPSQYTMEDLPVPNDKRIQFEVVDPKTWGVIRYTGFRSQSNNDEKANDLKDWLGKNKNYEIISNPSFAGYDPPWTIPFFRRNEMMFELKVKN